MLLPNNYYNDKIKARKGTINKVQGTLIQRGTVDTPWTLKKMLGVPRRKGFFPKNFSDFRNFSQMWNDYNLSNVNAHFDC